MLDQTHARSSLGPSAKYHCDCLHESAHRPVTSFYSMVLLAVVFSVGLYLWAKRRPVGQAVTWGEAFVGALVIFFYAIVIYALVPNAWLQWCTSGLRWRSDKVGIPLGPLHYWRFGIGHHTVFRLSLLKDNRKYFGFLPVDKGVLWPKGITFFGRGKIGINAQTCQDIVATLIYGIALGVHFKGWLWWQKRGQVKPATPELPTSAYGRPLVRKV